MSILPSECQRGCLMKKWESASVLIPSSSYSNTDTVHADTVISGSFCPLTTNNYTLKFSGSYTNYFSYVFDVVTGSNPSTIKRKLYKNHCYYFMLLIQNWQVLHLLLKWIALHTYQISGSLYHVNITEYYIQLEETINVIK